jgi:hypothetical protein
MDGRVLMEAMAGENHASPKVETKTFEATAKVNQKGWRQYLKVSIVDGRVYFDEGNGESR